MRKLIFIILLLVALAAYENVDLHFGLDVERIVSSLQKGNPVIASAMGPVVPDNVNPESRDYTFDFGFNTITANKPYHAE